MPTAPADPMPATPLAPRVRVGIGGWVYPAWRNDFYPPDLPQKDELAYASRRLGAIEINSTYYSPQKPATYARWRGETPDGFVFSLKAPRYCTERRTLREAGKAIAGFVQGGVAELGERLGPIVWQFAPDKVFEADDFAAFLDLLPVQLDGRPLRHVLEPRHGSFLGADYLALARRRGCASVYTDAAEYPSFADLTGDFVYARLMRSAANEANGYAAAALDAWARRARCWAEGGEPDDLPRIESARTAHAAPREVFVYFINAAKARNPAAALALQQRLGDAPLAAASRA